MAGYEQQHDYDAASGADEQEREARTGTVEPTTAELFATVQEALTLAFTSSTRDAGKEALADLKRRMGPMELVSEAATRVLGALALGRGPEADRQRVRDVEALTLALRDAQADAPPVFTLEEVKEATTKPNWYRDALNRSEEYKDGYEAALSDVLGRLAALRR